MKRLLLILVFLIGCSSAPHKADLLVRYPMEGKIVWMSEDGSLKQNPYFIISHEDFLQFLEKEREVMLSTKTSEVLQSKQD